jgi:hypothetical protein
MSQDVDCVLELTKITKIVKYNNFSCGSADISEILFTMKRQVRHSTNMSVSLPAQMQQQLRQAAFDDNRSVSSLVAALVDAYLTREGYAYSGREQLAPRPIARQTRLDLI